MLIHNKLFTYQNTIFGWEPNLVDSNSSGCSSYYWSPPLHPQVSNIRPQTFISQISVCIVFNVHAAIFFSIGFVFVKDEKENYLLQNTDEVLCEQKRKLLVIHVQLPLISVWSIVSKQHPQLLPGQFNCRMATTIWYLFSQMRTFFEFKEPISLISAAQFLMNILHALHWRLSGWNRGCWSELRELAGLCAFEFLWFCK